MFKKKRFSLILSVQVFLLFGAIILSSTFYLQNRQTYLKGKNVLYPVGQVLGVQTLNIPLTIDFRQKINTGSSEVFGAAHGPSLEHTVAWDMLRNIGVTSMRRDINLQFETPSVSSPAQYRSTYMSTNSTQSFSNSRMEQTKSIFRFARERGMKSIAVTAYMPTWLSTNGKNNGLAKDWAVYEDLVKKVYSYHRIHLDYIEISNEPDLNSFLDPTGTNLTRQEAYRELFLHTARAIRAVDQEKNDGKIIKIGGGVTSYPLDTSYLDALLKNPEAKGYLSFTSYHTYGHNEPTSTKIKATLSKYGLPNLPIHITEWNKSSDVTKKDTFHYSTPAITFTANKLMNFLNNGYKGANYFTMSASDPLRPNTVFSSYGIYEMINNVLKPYPQTKTWMVLSKKSGLGKGESNIYKTMYNTDTLLETIAFKNSAGLYGFAISNPTTTAYSVTVTLNNLDSSQRTKLTAYEASMSWDANQPKGSLVTNLANQNQVQIFVSPMTLVSVVLE